MVYGRNTVVERRDLWDDILYLGCNITTPWLLTGDVNCILNRDEKEGGAELTDNALVDMRDCVTALGLHDVASTGCYFTWNDIDVKSKLDRVMVNSSWRELGWNICTDFLPPGVESDHACAFTTIFGESGEDKKPFRFFNMWTKHDHFFQIVSDGWERDTRGTKQFILCKKLKGLKRDLKILNKKEFGHICERTEAAVNRLSVLQVRLLEGHGNDDTKIEIQQVKGRVNWLKKVEKAYLGQLAKNSNLVLERVGFSEGQLPVRYLGVPLALSTVKVSSYDVLINRLTDNIRKWSSNTLSYAGRLELIRSVVQGICCYWLSVLPMPATIIKRIESICKTYLWGSRRGLVAWEDVCRPKNRGGLGLRDLTTWNSALLAKIIWDVHNKKDSIWIKWVSEQYLNGRTIWDFVPRKTDSKLMRFVAGVRDDFVQIVGGVASAEIDTLVMCGKAKFDSKKMYFLIHPLPDRTYARYNMLWRTYIAPKYSFIGWLVLQGKLATKNRLQFLNIDPWCCHCINRQEDSTHVFWRCPYNRKI
ncbi:hypothetical protein ACS0TY_029490 [Phlomoides rotata]